MKLSLCIATFNEEKNLHSVLDSAYDLADEVVIVDGGSTDQTIQIAKSYGKKVKIIQTDNPPMFHINKQKAIDAAKGKWILQLDADEALSEELKEELKSVIISQSQLKSVNNKKNADFNRFQPISTDSTTVAYQIPRKNWFLSRFLMKGGQYPDYTIRLYKNGVARFPCKDVHENVEIINQKSKVKSQNYNSKVKSEENVIPAPAFAGVNSGGLQSPLGEIQALNQVKNDNNKIGYLKSPILHFSDPTFKRYWSRWQRYTTLEAKKLIINNEKLIVGEYLLIKPIATFFLMYFRHKGFMDGVAGFVFAFFSSIRFWGIYIKWRVRKLT